MTNSIYAAKSPRAHGYTYKPDNDTARMNFHAQRAALATHTHIRDGA